MSDLFQRPISIKLKQGLQQNINDNVTRFSAVSGEPHWTKDTNILFVYNGSTQVPINGYKFINVTGTGIDLGYSENVILCDCTSNAIVVNLPKSADCSGIRYDIKKLDSTSNKVDITPSGSETIDNQTGWPLVAQYTSVTLVNDGSGWWVI